MIKMRLCTDVNKRVYYYACCVNCGYVLSRLVCPVIFLVSRAKNLLYSRVYDTWLECIYLTSISTLDLAVSLLDYDWPGLL